MYAATIDIIFMNSLHIPLKRGLKTFVKSPNMSTSLKLAGLCLAAFLVSSSVQATTYYIATNGNDSWDGSSPTYVSGTIGPFADFRPINWAAAHQLAPGDVLYVLGGIYDHTSDSPATALRIYGVAATQSNPIIISNYPGQYPVIYGSGPNNNTIDLRGDCWIKIIGLNETNAYRGAAFQSITNCEIAYCDIGGGNTNFGYIAPFSVSGSSQSNWVHNCTVHDALAAPVGDSTHCMTFGLFYSTTDWTSYNVIESNICYHAGHDTLSVYGPYNLLRNNFIHNENWFFRQDFRN